MKIVVAASEAVPFAKTGGLADAASALSKALAEAGHEVALFLPHYPQAVAANHGHVPPIEPTDCTLSIGVGPRQVLGRVLKSKLPDSRVEVFLIDQPGYYDRPALYYDGQADYRDNCERFVFFSRAVLETMRQLPWRADVVHAHDWQTGLIPAALAIEYQRNPSFERCASLFTLHNLAFQGQFWHWDMVLTGLDWKYFNWHQMEFFGNLNLLKTGIVFADGITTVSPTYALEIQTPEWGCGLHGVLRGRSHDLTGILNGADTSIWNPATDRNLAQNYTSANVTKGKSECKQALQKRVGLPVRPEIPMAAMISRLTEQKGLELILARAERLLERDLQLVFLGTGGAWYVSALQDLARRHPDKVHATIGYDERLAHQIEAAADVYLMPSRFEPCGLNQMYSLIYGTVPIVRSTGGLADTVIDATPETLANRTATGFKFNDYDSMAFEQAFERALSLFADRTAWLHLMQSGMRTDWSWRRSAQQYLGAYERALSRAADRGPL